MDALNAKMRAVVSGDEPRYSAEFVRFLDSEIERLGKAADAQDASKRAGRFSGDKSVSLESLGKKEEEEDEEDEIDITAPDARSAMIVLSMIKVPPPGRLLSPRPISKKEQEEW